MIQIRFVTILFSFLFLLQNCSSDQKNISTNSIRQIPDNQKKWILFLDFENKSLGDKLQWDGLRRAIPAMILTDFKNFGVFKPIPEKEKTKMVQGLMATKKMDSEEEKLKAASAAKADYLMVGSFTESAGNVTISVKLFNTYSKKIEFSKDITGETKQILNPPEKSLIKQTSLGLLSQMKLDLKTNESEILAKDIETTALNAALNNYKGEMNLERAEYLKSQNASSDEIDELENKARSNFKDALKEDPKYAKAKANLGRIVSLLPPIY